jgi:hypothetical protein
MRQQMMPPTNGDRKEALWLPSHCDILTVVCRLFLIPIRSETFLSTNTKSSDRVSAMSDEHDNLDSPGSDTIINSSEPNHGLEIDATPDTSSISQLFRTCSWNYETLLSTLQTDTSRSAHTSISLVPEVKDEFSRLRIWGEQTYAVLPQNTRRSLDQRLREDEDTKKIVTRCLQRLNSHIEKGWCKIVMPQLYD